MSRKTNFQFLTELCESFGIEMQTNNSDSRYSKWQELQVSKSKSIVSHWFGILSQDAPPDELFTIAFLTKYHSYTPNTYLVRDEYGKTLGSQQSVMYQDKHNILPPVYKLQRETSGTMHYLFKEEVMHDGSCKVSIILPQDKAPGITIETEQHRQKARDWIANVFMPPEPLIVLILDEGPYPTSYSTVTERAA
jgi:hypothetical protein